MRHLAERVHACVGAAGAVDDDLFLRDFTRRVMQRTLDRRDPRLELPSVKVRAVVSDCDGSQTSSPLKRCTKPRTRPS